MSTLIGFIIVMLFGLAVLPFAFRLVSYDNTTGEIKNWWYITGSNLVALGFLATGVIAGVKIYA